MSVAAVFRIRKPWEEGQLSVAVFFFSFRLFLRWCWFGRSKRRRPGGLRHSYLLKQTKRETVQVQHFDRGEYQTESWKVALSLPSLFFLSFFLPCILKAGLLYRSSQKQFGLFYFYFSKFLLFPSFFFCRPWCRSARVRSGGVVDRQSWRRMLIPKCFDLSLYPPIPLDHVW